MNRGCAVCAGLDIGEKAIPIRYRPKIPISDMQPDIDGIGLDRKKTPMPTIDNMRDGSTEIQVMVRPRSTLFVFPCSPGILPASWGGDVASAGVSARACSSAAAAV